MGTLSRKDLRENKRYFINGYEVVVKNGTVQNREKGYGLHLDAYYYLEVYKDGRRIGWASSVENEDGWVRYLRKWFKEKNIDINIH